METVTTNTSSDFSFFSHMMFKVTNGPCEGRFTISPLATMYMVFT